MRSNRQCTPVKYLPQAGPRHRASQASLTRSGGNRVCGRHGIQVRRSPRRQPQRPYCGRRWPNPRSVLGTAWISQVVPVPRISAELVGNWAMPVDKPSSRQVAWLRDRMVRREFDYARLAITALHWHDQMDARPDPSRQVAAYLRQGMWSRRNRHAEPQPQQQ